MSDKKKLDLSFDPKEREGLTTAQVEELYDKWGYNELPDVSISLLWVFISQFMGTMPYMLELAAIIAIAVQDYADFGIIIALLTSNAVLGFQEQLKAAESLRELTQKMEQKIAALRDGHAEYILTRLLVPGDVVLLIGGCQVPADIEWLEGDVLSVDTAALTGEPLPRKYPSDDHGKVILAGTTIRAGEAYGVVRKTGINTEIGSASAEVLKDKTVHKISVFEERVLEIVKVVIGATLIDVLIIFIVQGTVQDQFTASGITTDLLTCLSIIVAAIPIALPIVLNVTMALGAAKMAGQYSAVVTSLPALQDISSMTVLCSDKTGTLTTAKITIHGESVWVAPGRRNFTQKDVAMYAGLASNRDKKEDAIDRSVINHFDRLFGEKAIQMASEYTKVRNVGFNPIYKRVLYEFTHPSKGRVLIAKGLPTKVLDTTDGEKDDAPDQWQCDAFETLKDIVKKVDLDFSKAGYKTLGVSIKFNDDPWEFVGILPMLDPPRHDTAKTIHNLIKAGIKVKMITGDHLNIARETARLIGMGVNIHAGEETREETHPNIADRDRLIWDSDGFAQVLPRDKREVVQVLRHTYKQVVGMTGDGVNDAPALSAAQCGIAVDDATDAARNAAAIILTSPGLSAVYSAVVESRRIFRKLKSYVTYRLAASIQIVIVLTLLIYISNCPIEPLLIILLALFNDITLLPIAYDNQLPSQHPENPAVRNILITSLVLGSLGTGFTMLFAYASGVSNIFQRNYEINSTCTSHAQGAVWLQMFIATEFLIFSARAPSFLMLYRAPSPYLLTSVLCGCLMASLMAGFSSQFGMLTGVDIVIIWFYNLLCLSIQDSAKVLLFKFFNENTEVIPDESEEEGREEQKAREGHEPVAVSDIEANVHDEAKRTSITFITSPTSADNAEFTDIYDIKANRSLSTLHEMTVARNAAAGGAVQQPAYIIPDKSAPDRIVASPKVSGADLIRAVTGGVVSSSTNINAGSRSNSSGLIQVNTRLTSRSASDLRSTYVGGNLRPNTPGQMRLFNS